MNFVFGEGSFHEAFVFNAAVHEIDAAVEAYAKQFGIGHATPNNDVPPFDERPDQS